ncbi:MAG TPA: glyoxylate/hydroxypyruvate reductase A [Stellaceae bacterium]
MMSPIFAPAQVWRECFAREMPEVELRFWPEIGNPAEIEFAAISRLPDNALRSLPNLKLIISLFAGQDMLLADKTLPANVPIVRAANPNGDRMMTETVMLHVLRHHRQLPELLLAQQKSEWASPKRLRTRDRKVGVMGLGPIGIAAAKALRDLGFQVAAWVHRPRQVEGIEVFHGDAQLDAFLGRSEIVVNLLPLTPETEDILGLKAFAAMPRGASVINLGRGQHVVDADLVAALDSGQLVAATLDVFRQEPLPKDSPLWRHPRVTVIPHASRGQFPAEIAPLICAHLRRFQRGEPMTDRVDLAAGY